MPRASASRPRSPSTSSASSSSSVSSTGFSSEPGIDTIEDQLIKNNASPYVHRLSYGTMLCKKALPIDFIKITADELTDKMKFCGGCF